jgi:hypothetical protein
MQQNTFWKEQTHSYTKQLVDRNLSLYEPYVGFPKRLPKVKVRRGTELLHDTNESWFPPGLR